MASEWPTRRDLGAIGAAIAVVAFILGLLAMLIFLKTTARNLARGHADEGQNNPQESTQLMGIAGVAGSKIQASTEPPLEDEFGDDLISDLKQLGGMIQHHVESNYVLDERQHDHGGLVQAIAGLPFLKHDAQFLAHLCAVPATRHAAIRHLIMATILSAVDFGTFHNHALLPPAVLTFWENLRPSHGDKKYTEGKGPFRSHQILRDSLTVDRNSSLAMATILGSTAPERTHLRKDSPALRRHPIAGGEAKGIARPRPL
jgi:hypothetical protein